MVQKANSGHPGTPLALTPFMHVLYGKVMKMHKSFLEHQSRDIFILSNGHACAIQYVMLSLHGILTINDLKDFRQLKSKTPGHPEITTNGIEATTGPLGQGIANAVGFAISIKKIKSKARVFVLFGDGCYQEGISHEAFAIASNLNLNNITFIYDSNNVTIDGSTELSMNEDAIKRFESYKFELYESNGENLSKIEEILNKESERPKVLILKTRIAEGCSRVGDFKTHGAPLGQSVVDELKEINESFEFANETTEYYAKRIEKNAEYFEKFENKKSEKFYRDVLKETLTKSKCIYEQYVKKMENKATREQIPVILDELSEYFPILGGSADLTPSTLTKRKEESDFNRKNYDGTYIRFGIREHAMFGILNGITAHGYFRSFGSTFLVFLTYGFASVRLSALSRIPNVYLLTHDSIGLGEDGPTHQPIEMLSLCRSTPNIYTFRPCDALETRFSMWFAMTRPSSPTVICFSRQKIPEIPETSSTGVEKGAYYLEKRENSKFIIFSTGSEISIALKIGAILEKENIPVSVVSMLSFELFEEQEENYKKSVLRNDVFKVSIEAASTFGWSKYVDYSFGVNEFGLSGKSNEIYEYFELTAEKIAEKIKKINFLKE